MTTLTLTIDKDTKRFELDDGPTHVHAGETVRLVLRGLGVTATAANGSDIPAEDQDVEGATRDDASTYYPALRARILHPVYGDVAIYPWPATPPAWSEEDPLHPGAGLVCDIDLDTEQLFRVVRNGLGGELRLLVERPWPESAPTVYGEYALRVEDWPEVTGEHRIYPTESSRHAFGALLALSDLGEVNTLDETMSAVNLIVRALQNLAKEADETEED